MKKMYLVGLAVGLVAVTLLIVMWPRSSVLEDSQESAVVEPAYQMDEPMGSSGNMDTEPDLSAPKIIDSSALAKATSTVSASKKEKLEKVVHASRIFDEFKAMDELLDIQFDQLLSAQDLSVAEQEEIEKLRNAVSGEKMMENYKQLMNEKFSEEELAQLREIYDKPIVSEAADREVYFQSQEGQKELIEHWKTFKPESVSPDRRKAIENYSKATGNIENTVKMIEKMTGFMSPEGSNAPAPDAAALAQTRKMIEESTFIKEAKTMENMTVEQISQLTKERSNPVMMKQQEVKQEVINSQMDNLGETVKNSMKDKDKD
ncbi:MAG: hypothetical protein HYW48_01955 [Deltaproteobacteria bacterium]|nr:hypothetical protein [Deltaproteobacteria bacterium]